MCFVFFFFLDDRSGHWKGPDHWNGMYYHRLWPEHFGWGNINTIWQSFVFYLSCELNSSVLGRQGPSLIINQPDKLLEGMSEWCKEHHGKVSCLCGQGLGRKTDRKSHRAENYFCTAFYVLHFALLTTPQVSDVKVKYYASDNWQKTPALTVESSATVIFYPSPKDLSICPPIHPSIHLLSLLTHVKSHRGLETTSVECKESVLWANTQC